MLLLLSAFVCVSNADFERYAIFRNGSPIAAARVSQPSGIHAFSAHDSVLTHAEVMHAGHFASWTRAQGISAVRAHSDAQPMPVVLAKGTKGKEALLQAFGRVSATADAQVFRVRLGPGIVDPEAVAKRIAALPGIDWAEADLWGNFSARGVSMNDKLYSSQWYLHESAVPLVTPGTGIRADEAWLITEGSNAAGRTRIAVLDDGFALAHPDLSNQWVREGSAVVGKDYVGDDTDPSAEEGDGHGTRVSGVAAAEGNNTIGIVGVCPRCSVLPVRVFTSGSKYDENALSGPMSVAADAILWSADHGARVINNSWGPTINAFAPQYAAMPATVKNAITNVSRRGPEGAPGGSGVLITWAAGNNPRQVASFDGWVSDPRVLAVGALNASGAAANYSELGPPVRLVAPSSEQASALPAIVTTTGQDAYSSAFGGSSAAAPIVAGVAALVLSAHPELSLAQLFEVLLDSAQKADVDNARYGRDKRSCTYGYGEVDARAALDLADQRTAAYASGNTLHFELCGDDIDNDGNPATPDTCAVCIPTSRDDTAVEGSSKGIDDDCDGLIDNPVACHPLGKERCAECTLDSQCAADFVCFERPDGKRCLRACKQDDPCAPGELCSAGTCLPERGGKTLECSEFTACTRSNGGLETCDGLDNDCNGAIDDISGDGAASIAATADCRSGVAGVCLDGVAKCSDGKWNCVWPESYVGLEATLCDGRDNDCDGIVDEGCPPKKKPGCSASEGDAMWILVVAMWRLREKSRARMSRNFRRQVATNQLSE